MSMHEKNEEFYPDRAELVSTIREELAEGGDAESIATAIEEYWLGGRDMAVIRSAAEAVRRNATAPSDLIHPHVQIDALIVWVADWIENPPAWVHVPYRTEREAQGNAD